MIAFLILERNVAIPVYPGGDAVHHCVTQYCRPPSAFFTVLLPTVMQAGWVQWTAQEPQKACFNLWGSLMIVAWRYGGAQGRSSARRLAESASHLIFFYLAGDRLWAGESEHCVMSDFPHTTVPILIESQKMAGTVNKPKSIARTDYLPSVETPKNT